MRKPRVTILTGGPFREHEVSVLSGQSIREALEQANYEVTPILIDRDEQWSLDLDSLKEKSDVIFVALHGKHGEDGTVQDFVRQADLPYTGSDVLANALAINKALIGNLLKSQGFNTPRFTVLNQEEAELQGFDFDLPAIIKPLDRALSLGISLVRREEEIEEGLQKAFGFSRQVIVQEYIPGRELTASVIDNGEDEIIPLPPTEIIPKMSSFFDYYTKHTMSAYEEIVPARLSDEVRDSVQEAAIALHKAIGASGMSKTDTILTDQGKLYVLEINTVPPMTPHSSLPRAALAHGLSLTELCERIIETAIQPSI